MNKTFTLKNAMVAAFVMAGSLPSFAYNNLFLKAEAYPTGAGRVYVSTYISDYEDGDADFQPVSEVKQARQTSDAFIWTEAAEGYLLAGYARDNGNGKYDNGVDQQVRVNPATGAFTAILDPEQYDGNGNTSQGLVDAENALAEMTEPTDYIFAVFTKGDVAVIAAGNEDMGTVTASRLDNSVGESVTFTAKADKNTHFTGWTDAGGTVVDTHHTMTVTVAGGTTYYAHFAEGAEDESAVHAIGQDAAVQPIYDLQGRRADATAKRGIYVKGNRKIEKLKN